MRKSNILLFVTIFNIILVPIAFWLHYNGWERLSIVPFFVIVTAYIIANHKADKDEIHNRN